MPPVTDPTQLAQLAGSLKATRSTYDETKEEIAHLFNPFKGSITTQLTPGATLRPLYDSFGVMKARIFTNWLSGTLWPSASDWVALKPKKMASGFDRTREIQLYDTSLRVMDALASSNFYSCVPADSLDWGTLGNSTLHERHDDEKARSPGEWGGLIFENVPYSRVWWYFSHIGRPLCLVREYEMPVCDAAAFFSQDGDRVPATWKDVYAQGPYTLVCFLHIVQRDHYGVKGTDHKPWSSIWFDKGSSQVIRRAGWDNLQYIASRMFVMSGEQYGRGIGDIARPPMKGCDEITRQEMIALGKELNPPFMAEEDEIAQLDLTPGGHVVVRPPKEVTPGYLRSGTDFKLVEMIRDGLHAQVNEAFLGDVLGEPETQTRSAEAERSRDQRGLARLAATGQTAYYEKGCPIIENTVDIMLEKGALPELQEAINEDPDFEYEIELTSPFFTAMKQQSLAKVERFLELRQQRFERTGDPAALEDIDFDELRELEKKLGDVPARLFKEQQEIERMRNARGDRATDEILTALAQRAKQSQTQVQLRPQTPRGGI